MHITDSGHNATYKLNNKRGGDERKAARRFFVAMENLFLRFNIYYISVLKPPDHHRDVKSIVAEAMWHLKEVMIMRLLTM